MKTKLRVYLLLGWGVLLVAWQHGLKTLAASEAPAAPETPVEIGRVAWLRDLDDGLAQAQAAGKPVFLLFQEVPGCAGCQEFGRGVLSDAQVVAAIEAHFVPVFIPNNRPGKAAEVLKRYGEPAWNYQVVRFLSADGKDLIPRQDKIWTVPALAERMVRGLEKAGRPVSEALRTLAGQPATTATTAPRRKVAFAQACFWTGEMRLGQIEGVERTEAGFFDGREVTLVEFDPRRVSLPDLVKAALARQCADGVYPANTEDKALAETIAEVRRVGLLDAGYRAAPAADQKKQIQGTPAQGLSLTPEQATKVNAFIRTDPEKAARYLASHR